MSRKFLTPIVLPADPAVAMEAATKQYVDSKAGGISEVWIGTAAPGDSTTELWYDTDDPTPAFDETLRWNTAWGIAAIGRMKEESTGAAFVANQVITDSLVFTSKVGRRYRVRCTVRAIALTTGTGGLWLRFAGTAWPSLPDTHQYSSGQWQHIAMEASFVGDGTTKTHWVETAQPATMHFGMPTSFFYIEDVGPAGSYVSMAAPFPQWLQLPFNTGWSNYDAPGPTARPVQYRMVGDEVQLRGVAKCAAAVTGGTGNYIIGTLPVGYRFTASNMTFPANMDNALKMVTVNGADGAVCVGSAVTVSAYVFLDNVRFSVTT